VVSALPQRAENKLHVSLMENYPGTLEALGEPIRQVRLCSGGGLCLAV
jgi:obscurin-RhoGEF protein